MHNDIAHVLLSEEQLKTRIAELGELITNDYRGRSDIVLIGVLKGCTVFMVDLARTINLPLAIDFIATSSYGSGTHSSGVVRLLKDLDMDIAGKHVIIVEDIIDSGLTLAYLHAQFSKREPACASVPY
jgi:hypoxanthine phosphoribosyltransferase